MVDPERATGRLARLGALLTQLERLRVEGRQDDPRDQLAALHGLQLAIQISIDFAGQLVAERSTEVPDRYRELFPALARAGVIDADLGERLADAASMRNVIVHEYLDVDIAIVWRVLGELDDLRRFAATVAAEIDDTST